MIEALAAENLGFAKKRTSSMGWVERRSHQTKSPRSTSPQEPVATTTGSLQPSVGASMIANSSAVSPMMDMAAPTGSTLGPDGSLEFGIRKKPARRPTRTIGRFTRNTEPQ